jgi:hypothetical protein
MKRILIQSFLLFCVLAGESSMAKGTETPVLLRVTYHATEGSDIEHGQGAIERNELAHCVLAPTRWLIRVPPPGDREEWRTRLDASVSPTLGCFEVEEASEDERIKAERGELHFQQ